MFTVVFVSLLLDDPRRGKKVKRSPLHGIFRRNQKPSAVPPSGCLFGHSLDEISDGDKLPEPILVIIIIIITISSANLSYCR